VQGKVEPAARAAQGSRIGVEASYLTVRRAADYPGIVDEVNPGVYMCVGFCE